MLLLTTDSRSHVGNPTVSLDLRLGDLEKSSSSHLYLTRLYLRKEYN